MSEPLSLLIVGHSHTHCLRRAVMERSDTDHVTVINLRTLQPDGEPLEALIAKLREAVSGLKPDAVCLCLGGNLHNVIGLIENPVPFSVGVRNAGSAPPPSGDRVFVPHAVMRDYFQMNTPKKMASDIYALFPDALKMYVNPPPPIPDFEYIKLHPGSFADKLDQGGGPNALRIALYTIQTDAFRNLADHQQAVFVDVDDRLRDADGFLRPEYFNQDPTHGNVAYGEIMLNRIMGLAERPS